MDTLKVHTEGLVAELLLILVSGVPIVRRQQEDHEMQGKKRFKTKLFYSLSLEEMVPEDHLLRRFDSLLSLDFLREETRRYYSHTGQPSVDPLILFKMMLLGYLYGISSERKLAKEIQVNLAYRWYLGYDLDEATPNHSVLSKARCRFPEEVFRDFFGRVVQLCVQRGLVTGTTVCLDSTLIKANASLDSFVEVKESAESFVQRVYKENDFAADDPVMSDGTIGRLYDGEVDPSKMGQRRKRCFVNSRLKSTTDPEAAIVFRAGTGRQAAFKGHLAIDADSRVITAVTASSGSADDTTAVDPLLREHLCQTGELPQQIVADSHYGTAEVYRYLDERGVRGVISPRRTRNRPGLFTIDDFQYDQENDCYLCPQGERLKLKCYQRTVHRKVYLADKKVCDLCPIRAQCTTSQKQGRMITRFIDDYFEEAQELVDSAEGKRLLRQRQTVIEGVIGEAKSFHLLKRALFRGKAKLKIQLLVTAAVLNLKRLMKWKPKAKAAIAPMIALPQTLQSITCLSPNPLIQPALH
jgi:transposase